MMRNRMTRRGVLETVGAATGVLTARAVGAAPKRRKRVLRVAHLTDVHIQPELKAGEGLAACMEHALQQKPSPDLILNTGDSIMDSFSRDEARTRTQWAVWDAVLRDYGQVPIRHCIGNHDVWGWNKGSSRTSGNEPLWGKRWAMERFSLSRPHYSFDRAGWHFVALDSTYPKGETAYTARLDDEQFEWLVGDLAAVPKETPILVFSHIPILCAAAYLDGQNEKSGDWVVPGAWMHIDARRIKDLFLKHPNVKLALSGHIHLADRVDYNGVTYLCNGAVSGAWWKGSYHETQPGYALVDLYSDGTFSHQYVPWGWTAP